MVAAHPDDEILGCGASIKRFIDEGNEAYCLVLSDGVTSRYNKENNISLAEIQERNKEARAASKIIGFKEMFFLNYPDNKFDSLPLLDIIKSIEEYIERIKPNIVFTHHYSDLNVDHRKTFQAVITAARPIEGCTIKEIYCFENPSSTEWNFPYNQCFKPNYFVDVEKTFKYKIEGMKCYKSEIREYPHPRSLEALEINAKRWGTVLGCKLVEAFELVRKLV